MVCRYCQICAWLSPPLKSPMTQHTDLLQTAALFASWTRYRLLFSWLVRKKENTITHLYPLQQEKGITYWELLYLYYMRFSRQEEPLEKEPDYSHVQESKKSKEQAWWKLPRLRRAATFLENAATSLPLFSMYLAKLQHSWRWTKGKRGKEAKVRQAILRNRITHKVTQINTLHCLPFAFYLAQLLHIPLCLCLCLFFYIKEKEVAHSLEHVCRNTILYQPQTATGEQSATLNTGSMRDCTHYGPFVTRAAGHQIFISFD